MTQTYASGKSLILTQKLNPWDTSFFANIDVWVDTGRIFFTNWAQKEWVKFTWISASWDNFEYTWLTRQLSQTSDPSTSWWSGYTWIGGTTGVLVAMHDQIPDKQENTTFSGSITTTDVEFSNTTTPWLHLKQLTTAQRLALTPENGIVVYDTDLWENYQYIAGAWSAVSSWSTQPNASTTVAGKVEIATTAQSIAGTDNWETGAKLIVLPSDIAKNEQNSSHTYGSDTGGDDAYVVTLSPVLVSYAEWQEFSFKVTTANTGACSVDFWPWAKSIKRKDWTDPVNGEVTGIVNVIYDGTNFVLQDQEKLDMANTTTTYTASRNTQWTSNTTSVQLTRWGLINIEWWTYESTSWTYTIIVRLEYSTDNAIWNTAVEFFNWDASGRPTWDKNFFSYLWNAWIYYRWYISITWVSNDAPTHINMTIQQRN